MIDGINTIKITGAGGRFTFWVNPVNYLPVQANLGPRQTEFHWLAPTPAHLAHAEGDAPGRLQAGPRAQGACAPRSRGRGYIDDRSLSRRRGRPGPVGPARDPPGGPFGRR